MKICIVTPARAGSRLGNAVTAERYAAFFRSAGWRCDVLRTYAGEKCDVLIALHARKSARSVLAFRKRFPLRTLVVVLTGTDLYRDLPRSAAARRSLRAASRIIVLQPRGMQALAPRARRKAQSIMQSSPARASKGRHREPGALRVCVLGHLRPEKDPLRAALAVRSLPLDLDVKVTQAGAALDRRSERAARNEMARNARYRWIGEISHAAAMRLLASSDAMVISSCMEGGANVVCEAIARGVPVLASAIDGNTGILGARYPGLFSAGDTRALARLLEKAANEPAFLRRLRSLCRSLRPLVDPRRERRAWIGLLRSLALGEQRSP